MAFWIVPPPSDLLEISIAPEIHVDGIGAIEFVNGCVRVYLYSEQMPLEARGAQQKLVTAKLIGPVNNLPRIIGQLVSCLYSDKVPEADAKRGPHLVT